MTEASVDIPKRALFRAAEVCEIAQLQPYVLRSWEQEFPQLGVSKAPGTSRVYRRGDLEQVLRIKQLVFSEGLTLAGARRRLDEETRPVAVEMPLDELLGRDARERLTDIKRGLRSILDLLSREESGNGWTTAAPVGPVRIDAKPKGGAGGPRRDKPRAKSAAARPGRGAKVVAKPAGGKSAAKRKRASA